LKHSFFSSLQRWVKNEAASDFAGRFIAHLIAEVAQVDPKPFQRFFASVTGRGLFLQKSFRIDRELEFAVSGRVRRADLVVSVDGSPKAIVELKYRDRLTGSEDMGDSQLADYLVLRRQLRSRPRFILLYRDLPALGEVRKIKDAGQCPVHLGALAPFLKQSDHPASSMLLDYLREEGLVIEPIDADHLYRFMHRLVLPWTGSGRINQTKSVEEGPIQFQRVLSNMKILAADITPKVRAAAGLSGGRAATVDFEIRNSYSKGRLQKAMVRAGGSAVDLDTSTRSGGTISIWVQNALVSAPQWLYLYYGFDFQLTVGKPMSVDAFVYFESPQIQNRPYLDERFSYVGSLAMKYIQAWRESNLESEFLQVIRRVARTALKSSLVTDRRCVSTFRRLSSI
jgi:hypothetical protein